MRTYAEIPAANRRAMSAATVAQCFGCVGLTVFPSGLMLLYLNTLGAGRSQIITILASFTFVTGLFMLPGARLAQRFGKKRIGFLGQACSVLGFTAIVASGFLGAQAARLLAAAGIVLHGLGVAMMEATWYALLSPIIPEDFRGRFFGRLRFAWNLVGIAFTLLATFILGADAPRPVFQCLFGLVTAGMCARFFFYARIPEWEPERAPEEALAATLGRVVRSPGFAPFCAYVFLLVLFTAESPALFGLLGKRVLRFGDDLVATMGLLLMVGSVLGFLAAGPLIDRFGTKVVFVSCHLGFGTVLSLFLLRGALPGVPLALHVAGLYFLFGLLTAHSSVAFTSEMLGIMPEGHKTIAAAAYGSVRSLAQGLAGTLWGTLLRLGLLSETWVLRGRTLSAYDSVLLFCAVMVVFLVITLALVPSVVRKAQLLPR